MIHAPLRLLGHGNSMTLTPLLFAAVLAATPHRTSAPPDSVLYAVLFSGHRAGTESVVRRADGSLQYHYEFNDRGRGPGIDERVVLGRDRIPRSLEISGHDYFKAPVHESLEIHDSTAEWSNTSEHGSGRAGGFYISLNGVPDETALLARALLAAPRHRLALLPAGEASLEKRGDLTLRRGSVTRRVTQYAIAGLDFTPTPIWLDADGTMFAQSRGWFAVVRSGWDWSLDSLNAAQNAVETERLAAIARRVAHSPSGALAFEHARLFDTEHGAALPGRTVVIQGHRIVAVGEDGKVAIPAGAEVIDATGRTLLPGLWDMHVHLSPSDGLMHMACGVTSVRDMGNDIDILARIRKQWDAGAEVGPRVIPAGLIDGRGPFQGPTKVFADSLPEALAAVDRYADLGYAQIKIYSSVHPELVQAIAAEAHRRGLRVSGHVPAFMTAEQFIRAGVDEIQHMNFIFLNFMADSILDTRSTARFTFPARLSAGLDLHSARVQQFIQLMRDRRIVLDPTLGVFEGLFTDRPGEVSHTIGVTGDRLPIQVRRGFTTGGLEVPPGMDARYRDSFQRMLEMTKALHEGGVTIVAGTDGMAGFMLHRELELYVKAGLTPAEVLQIATLSAARVMKRDADLGSIAPGKLADVILVDGNPDQRIEDIRKVELVMKDGTLYRTRDLDEALGVRPLPAMAAETPPR